MPQKDGLSKKDWGGIDLSCIIWKEDGIVFSRKYDIFWTENERWSFSGNIWKYDNFCLYVSMLQIWYYPSAIKVRDEILMKKYT